MSNEATRQLKLGAILSYLAIGINIIAGLIYSPWMLSKVGASDYGLYTLSSSLIHIFLLDFGISSAVSRFTSKYLAEGRQDKVDELLAVVYKLFAMLSAVITVIFVGIYFFIDQIYVSLTVEELARFKVVYIIAASFNILAFPFSATVNGIMTSYEKFIQMKLCDVINKVLTVLLIVSALMLGCGIYELVAINAIVNLAIYALKILIIKKSTPIKLKIKFWDVALLREIFSFSIWVLINSISSRLIMNLCPNVLGNTSGTFAITIFSFSSTIEGYTYTFSSAIDGMFIPRIARYIYKDKDMAQTMELMNKVGKYQFCLIGLIVVGFACLGNEFVSLWIGEEYHIVYYCTLLLLLPTPFYVSQQIGKSALIVANKVKYLAYVNIGKAIINIILVYIFSKYFGVIGACAAICIVYLIRNEAYIYLYRKCLGFETKKFRIQCQLRMLVPAVAALLLGLAVVKLYPVIGWIPFIIKGTAISIIYLICMMFLGFSKGERNAIAQRIRKHTI